VNPEAVVGWRRRAAVFPRCGFSGQRRFDHPLGGGETARSINAGCKKQRIRRVVETALTLRGLFGG
jgi:hypothetical protein